VKSTRQKHWTVQQPFSMLLKSKEMHQIFQVSQVCVYVHMGI